MSEVTFSIILPLYKQADQIDRLVTDYVTALSSQPETWELILVVNGGDDLSFSKTKKYSLTDKRIISLKTLQNGWGRAVRCGMENAQGTFCCYTNSARTQLKDLKIMLRYALANKGVVIKATRTVRESIIRKFASIIYNLENRFLFQTATMDVNGTPKIFTRDIWSNLSVVSNNDLIDAEVMAKCSSADIPVFEIPVKIFARRSGRSTTNILSALKMYIGLYRLYLTLSK